MPKLIITRGLPGSGKSTWARGWVRAGDARIRVNRDDLRMMYFDRAGVLTRDQENFLTSLRDQQIRNALDLGHDVVVDDTNLRLRYARELAKIAWELGADFEVDDRHLSVPVEVCIERDLTRLPPFRVGEAVIRRMHKQFFPMIHSQPVVYTSLEGHFGEAVPEPYVALQDTPPAILVDLDGTLALMGDRKPFDWLKVGSDAVNQPVRDLVNWVSYGYGLAERRVLHVIFMSGRDESCRTQTLDWLQHQAGLLTDAQGFDNVEDRVDFGFELFMREAGDSRKDSVVKLELFDRHVRNIYDVQFVLDDRNQVVDMWRTLGLTCLQVAPGDF